MSDVRVCINDESSERTEQWGAEKWETACEDSGRLFLLLQEMTQKAAGTDFHSECDRVGSVVQDS